ncbi:MAG: hypothetical protein AB7S26_19870 [Sandaracinaceae bacterium]
MGLRESSPAVWHLLMCLLVILVTSLALGLAVRRLSRVERAWIWAGLGVHVLASFALLLVIVEVYGIGDVVTFFRQGELLVRYVHAGGDTWDLVLLVFQQQVHFPFLVLGIGSPTGSMSGAAAFLLLAVNSIWAGNLIVGLFAFSGELALYVGLRPFLAPEQRLRALLAALFVPSLTFWCGGLVKEAVAMGGLGWLCFGLSTIARRQLHGALICIPAVVCVALAKPYFLLPTVIAASVWFYWERGLRTQGIRFRVHPGRLVVVLLVAVVGVVAFGTLFPQYSIENLGEQAAMQQYFGARVEGGSNYQTGAGGQDRSLVGQLAFAPLGLVSAWFRPFPFEISNAAIFVSSAEATALLLLFLRVFWVLGPAQVWRRLLSSPVLMACLAFAVLSGIGIGIASTNLGSLSRYRAPMMPFFVLMLLLLDQRRPVANEAKSDSHSSTTRSRS